MVWTTKAFASYNWRAAVIAAARIFLSARESIMAKGQQRSNREKKKPKQDKAKPVAGASQFSTGQAGLKKSPGGEKKS